MLFDKSYEPVSGTLNDCWERLNNLGFIYVHEDRLVNFRFIESIGKNSVILTDERKPRLSRNRVEEAKKNCCCFCAILYLNSPNAKCRGKAWRDENVHLKDF